MQTNKEADLTTAVLMYAVRCLAEGDQLALRSMQFGPKEVDALQQLNISDLYRVETLRGHCLEVNLNREVFWHLVARLRQERLDAGSQRGVGQLVGHRQILQRRHHAGLAHAVAHTLSFVALILMQQGERRNQ